MPSVDPYNNDWFPTPLESHAISQALQFSKQISGALEFNKQISEALQFNATVSEIFDAGPMRDTVSQALSLMRQISVLSNTLSSQKYDNARVLQTLISLDSALSSSLSDAPAEGPTFSRGEANPPAQITLNTSATIKKSRCKLEIKLAIIQIILALLFGILSLRPDPVMEELAKQNEIGLQNQAEIIRLLKEQDCSEDKQGERIDKLCDMLDDLCEELHDENNPPEEGNQNFSGNVPDALDNNEDGDPKPVDDDLRIKESQDVK